MLKEHWEEGLRGLEIYQHRELPMYNADTPEKVAQVATDLAEADYLHFYSSRLFGTIPRLPEDYPIPYNMTRAFYPLLFAGELGYELVHVEQKVPLALGRKPRQRRLRPSWADPARGHRRLHARRPPRAHGLRGRELQRLRPSAGAGVREHGAAQRRPAAGDSRPRREARWAPQFDPMLMPADEWERQQAGGTLRDITPSDGVGARWPVVPVWLLAVYAGTLVTLPLGARGLPRAARPWLPAGATAGAAAVDVRPLAPCEPWLDWVWPNEHCLGLSPDGA